MDSLTIPLARSAGPLYRQLYRHLAGEIQAGRLAAGEKLPSKRRLAADLGVSVNTVDTAYGMLAAEGYVQARPRSGFTVCRLERLAAPPSTPAAPGPAAPEPPRPAWRYDFETASIDTSLFPFKTWRRIQRDVLAGDPALLNHGPRQGDEDLRAAIARHLREYRAVRCAPEQVVVGAGIEYLLGLLARLFCQSRFAVEDPGYARTARILQNNGVEAVPVAVDGQGLRAGALGDSGAQIAYVTPSHQFPTGVTMPAARRYELLAWAGAAPGRFLIEDDYDSEFRFDSRPLPSLQGLDEAGRVLYIGTFSKSVAPAIRIAYLVLPPALLPRWRAAFGFYSCTVSRFEQKTLCRFMESGAFARHLGRLRTAYRARRDALTAELRQAFPAARIAGTHTGLHLLLTPGGADMGQPAVDGAAAETALVARAAKEGVHLMGLSSYYRGPGPHAGPPTVVLGYAGLPAADIAPAVAALRRAWGPLQETP